MPNQALFLFQGHGGLETAWVRECFGLFKEANVNIRKLLLLKTEHSEQFSHIEIQFALPDPDDAFLSRLEHQAMQQAWQARSITQLS